MGRDLFGLLKKNTFTNKTVFNGNKGVRILKKKRCCILLFTSMVFFTFFIVNGAAQKTQKFNFPPGYLQEPEQIPAFWISTVDEVNLFLSRHVQKGHVKIIGISAGGLPIYAVFYGEPRSGNGTSTFSGSLGYGDVRVYRGTDHNKKVYLGIAGVHGGEFEGIVGIVNLISVLETGKDLNGKEWPEISSSMRKLDRTILVPIINPDGRARVPLRMELYRGITKTANTVYEYLNTGGKIDGINIGWPQVKENIPLDFAKVGFPGGYPNDAGVNIQHDNFMGKIQPETRALFDLTEREKPDLIINLHTGAVYMRMDHPLGEPALNPAFDKLFRYVHSELALKGLQYTKDPKKEGDPANASTGVYNLDGALNWHCGALSVVVESPSHGFAGKNEAGKPVILSPEDLIDGELICHQQAMKFLAETGGRSKWLPGRKH
jgi:hypothetical protein